MQAPGLLLDPRPLRHALHRRLTVVVDRRAVPVQCVPYRIPLPICTAALMISVSVACTSFSPVK